MIKILIAAMLCLSPLVMQGSLLAGESDTLGSCMVDSLTGKERKELAKWVFISMAAHPDLRNLANFTDQDKAESDRFFAALLTRLLADDCPEEARSAYAASGSMAIEQAFGLVGQVAMQELMTNEEVSRSFASPEKYVDHNKLNSVLVR